MMNDERMTRRRRVRSSTMIRATMVRAALGGIVCAASVFADRSAPIAKTNADAPGIPTDSVVHEDLLAVLESADEEAAIPIIIWVAVDTLHPPRSEDGSALDHDEALDQGVLLLTQFLRDQGIEPTGDRTTPVLYARCTPAQIRDLQRRSDVAGLYLDGANVQADAENPRTGDRPLFGGGGGRACGAIGDLPLALGLLGLTGLCITPCGGRRKS